MGVRKFTQEILAALRGIVQHSTLGLDARRPQVFLHVSEKIRIRTLREMIVVFGLAGYQVLLRARLSRWILSVAKELEWHENASLVWRGAETLNPPILGTDDPRYELSSQSNQHKIIHIRYDYNPKLKLEPGHYAMPLTMHPQIYVQYHEHERLEKYRCLTRKIKVIFAGNNNPEGYNLPIMNELFGKLSRYQILEFLQTKNFARVIKSNEELRSLLSADYCNDFILLDPSVRMDQSLWLNFVAQADFFLCPPGILFPPSHNAIEAMAVGTIPFTNYPDWFLPHLNHLENCVTFSTLEELEQNLKQILEMRPARISEIRQSVIGYYSHHLCPKTVVDQLIGFPAKEVYLHVLEEEENTIRRAMST